MSTRWYNIYMKGNPQLRVFLPNFWMKLIKPDRKTPINQVTFMVSMEMTRYDIKNYLEKIYNIPVIHVSSKVYTGEIKPSVKGYLIKDEDYRVAFVTLPKGNKFDFPNLFPENDKNAKLLEETEKMKKDFQHQKNLNILRHNVPTWFGY